MDRGIDIELTGYEQEALSTFEKDLSLREIISSLHDLFEEHRYSSQISEPCEEEIKKRYDEKIKEDLTRFKRLDVKDLINEDVYLLLDYETRKPINKPVEYLSCLRPYFETGAILYFASDLVKQVKQKKEALASFVPPFPKDKIKTREQADYYANIELAKQQGLINNASKEQLVEEYEEALNDYESFKKAFLDFSHEG